MIMNKEEQIKEIADLMADTMRKSFGLRYKDFAEKIYNLGYRKVPDGAVILTPEERDEELKACNEKQAKLEAKIEKGKVDYYIKGVEDGRQDFELIKTQNFELLEEVKQLEAANERFVFEVKKFDEFARDISKTRIEITGEATPTCKTLLKYIEKEKRNAVKEFAERLKEKFGEYEVWHYNGTEEGWHDLKQEIDECVKEFTE